MGNELTTPEGQRRDPNRHSGAPGKWHAWRATGGTGAEPELKLDIARNKRNATNNKQQQWFAEAEREKQKKPTTNRNQQKEGLQNDYRIQANHVHCWIMLGTLQTLSH